MKIVHLSTHDVWGGAAIAAHRLHTGLRVIGQDSTMFVAERAGSGEGILRFVPAKDWKSRIARTWRRKSIARELKEYTKSPMAETDLFSDDHSQHGYSPFRQIPACDLLHLHWVSDFIDVGALFNWLPRGLPVVWTLHDMNPFTGGCHFDAGCGRHSSQCGACPKLRSKNEGDISRRIWKRKQMSYNRIPSAQLQLVAPSDWTAGEVRRSALLGRFPVTVIPYGVDVNAFAPRDRAFARATLDIPQNAKVLIFGAQIAAEPRKGLSLLAEALAGLRDVPNLFLLIVGRTSAFGSLGIPYRSLGYVADERLLSMLYSAADLCVVPSLQETGPMVPMESLACGTPVIGFPAGDMPQVTRENQTGMLVHMGDSEALRQGIRQMLASPEMLEKMRAECRQVAVDRYSVERLTRDYTGLYEKLIGAASVKAVPSALQRDAAIGAGVLANQSGESR